MITQFFQFPRFQGQPRPGLRNSVKPLAHIGRTRTLSARDVVVRIVVLGLLPVVLGGCAASPSGASRETAGVSNARPASTASAGDRREDRMAGEWGVLLERFAGQAHRQRAEARAAQLRQDFPRDTLRVEPEPERSVILLGAFESPSDRDAQRALERVKAFEVNGRPVYARAFLARPRIDPRGSTPTISLVNAARAAPPNAAYTLQVEIYDAERRSERMRLAEARARELRLIGEEAYYHHGPRFSVVTIGIFLNTDFDESVGRGTPKVQAAQGKYPYMLLNGQRYRFSGATADVPTLLIRLPE